MAFKVAGLMAFKNAGKKANPALLEPVMKVEVVVPEEYMGDVDGRLELSVGDVLKAWKPEETPKLLEVLCH